MLLDELQLVLLLHLLLPRKSSVKVQLFLGLHRMHKEICHTFHNCTHTTMGNMGRVIQIIVVFLQGLNQNFSSISNY